MDVAKIKALLLAIDKKSFSKAAEELSYTPSAFSHIVDSIEEELGVKVLNRSFNGVELNENGKILLDKFTTLVNAEKELLLCAKKLDAENLSLRIGTYSSIARYILPEIIKQFIEEHPTVKVTIKVGNELSSWLTNDVADVLFTDQRLNSTKRIEIMKDPYMVLAPSGLLKNKRTVKREQLYPLSCVVHNESIFKNYFDVKSFKEIIKYDSIDESSVISMVEKNIGIAILPSLMLKNKPKTTHVLNLSPELYRSIGFVYKDENVKNKAVLEFIKFIKKTTKA